jgi:cytochrome c5
MRLSFSRAAAAAMAQGVTSPSAAAGADAAANLPDRPGKDQIVQSCSGCHQPDIVIGQKRDAAAWRDLVDQMIARGANVEEAKYEEIVTYLAQGN